MEIAEIEKNNAEYWNELCGSSLAQHLGITDSSPQSLKKFDDWYFDFYPYLTQNVEIDQMKGKSILDVGLGYGTLGAKLVGTECKSYVGYDIAQNPVSMMNHRIAQMGQTHKAKAVQGSILKPEFESSSFDVIVSIGCIHHTGDMGKAVSNIYKLLKPGGKAYIMVYNAYSYRQWRHWPLSTFKFLLSEIFPSKIEKKVTEEQRKAYDAKIDGTAAPETDFLSTKQIRSMFNNFSSVHIKKENCTDMAFLSGRIFINRSRLLGSLGRISGLDLYITAVK